VLFIILCWWWWWWWCCCCCCISLRSHLLELFTLYTTSFPTDEQSHDKEQCTPFTNIRSAIISTLNSFGTLLLLLMLFLLFLSSFFTLLTSEGAWHVRLAKC
jgi:hypothetical protein